MSSRRDLSDFSFWFQRQFGALPKSPEQIARIEASVQHLRSELAKEEAILRHEQTLTLEWRAALYAHTRAMGLDPRGSGGGNGVH